MARFFPTELKATCKKTYISHRADRGRAHGLAAATKQDAGQHPKGIGGDVVGEDGFNSSKSQAQKGNGGSVQAQLDAVARPTAGNG